MAEYAERTSTGDRRAPRARRVLDVWVNQLRAHGSRGAGSPQALLGGGLQVVGVHSPEFDHEHDVASVRKAIARLDIPYPVAIDNDYRIWRSFANEYWPALYLLDRRGRVVWSHVGELHQDTAAWTELTRALEAELPPQPSSRSPR